MTARKLRQSTTHNKRVLTAAVCVLGPNCSQWCRKMSDPQTVQPVHALAQLLAELGAMHREHPFLSAASPQVPAASGIAPDSLMVVQMSGHEC